jgi:hypothetical protein
LRAACPVLPSEQTVDAYKATGDLTDGPGVPTLLRERLYAMIRSNNTPQARTGYLVQDEIRIACGVVYRVRDGSVVGFVTDQTYFGDTVIDPKTKTAKVAKPKPAAEAGGGGSAGAGAGAGASAGAGAGAAAGSGGGASGGSSSGAPARTSRETDAQRLATAKLHARVAKNVLVWMYISADSTICIPVSLQYTTDIDPGQAFTMSITFMAILRDLHKMGITVTLIVGDNASVNRVRGAPGSHCNRCHEQEHARGQLYTLHQRHTCVHKSPGVPSTVYCGGHGP